MKTLTLTLYFLALTCHLASAQPLTTSQVEEKSLRADQLDKLTAIKSRANTAASEAVLILDAQSWATMPELVLDLPGGSSIVLQRADVSRSSDSFSWKAATSMPGATARFDVFGEDVYGVVQTPGFHFLIEPLG